MPRATPTPLRRVIRLRFQRGQSAAQISAELALPDSTVRSLVRRFADDPGDGIRPHYDRCGQRRDGEQQTLFQAACTLRDDHPRWGAGMIRLHLPCPAQKRPATRTVARWLKQAGLAPAAPGRPPARPGGARARAAHAVWQMDGAEGMTLASGQPVCWLRLTDEFSGAVLMTAIFPPGEVARGWATSHPRGAA